MFVLCANAIALDINGLLSPMIQSSRGKRWSLVHLTAKKPNNADKNVQKNSEIFKPNLHKVTGTGTNIVAIWLSSCLSPVFCQFANYCSNSRHFFSWEDSKLQVLKSFRKLENDTYRVGVLIIIQCILLVAAKKIVCHVPVAISFFIAR